MITLCTNFKRNRPTCRPWSLRQKLLSAYEVKNECALFKRLFKVKKNGAFCFGISSFILEIFTFLYYANEVRDGVRIKDISRNIGAVFFKLGTRNVQYKRNRITPTMLLPCYHGNSLGPSLFSGKPKFKLSVFSQLSIVSFISEELP